jgi:hypothetical protein
MTMPHCVIGPSIMEDTEPGEQGEDLLMVNTEEPTSF